VLKLTWVDLRASLLEKLDRDLVCLKRYERSLDQNVSLGQKAVVSPQPALHRPPDQRLIPTSRHYDPVYHKKVQQANQQRAREEFHRLRDPTNLARGLRPDSIRHLEEWALADVEVRVCMAEDIQDDGTFRLDRMPFVPTDDLRLVHSRCQLDEWIVVRNRFVYARMGAWSALRLVAVNVGTENRQRFVVTSAATIGLIFENNLDRGVNGRKVNIEPAWKGMGLDHFPPIVKRAIWSSFLEYATIDSCFMPKHPETTADEAGIFEDFAPNQAHINPVE